MKVLLVSIAFPPKRDPESLQVAKYCKYLKAEPEVDLQVVTSGNPTLNMEVDPSLAPYCEGIEALKELPIFENRYLNFLIRKVSTNLLRFPDSKFSFWWQSSRISQSMDRPDLLYSRSYPISSTLTAYDLKKKWNIPWVLHLSDPWAVATEESLSPARLSGRALHWNRSKEGECLGLADKICFTSRKTIELYSEKYPKFAQKFEYYPNVYDDELNTENRYVRKSKLTFLYTGGFADFRSPVPLLEAIRRFWKDPRVDGSNVEFLFTGEMSRGNRKAFKDCSDISIIKHIGVIPYQELLLLQKGADVLINVDTNILDPKQAVYFPSKLLDYIVAQRRIIAITNSYSTTFDVVEGKLGDCFDFDQVEPLAQHLFMIYEKHCNKEDDFFSVNGIEREYSARYNAMRLAHLFKSLM